MDKKSVFPYNGIPFTDFFFKEYVVETDKTDESDSVWQSHIQKSTSSLFHLCDDLQLHKLSYCDKNVSGCFR